MKRAAVISALSLSLVAVTGTDAWAQRNAQRRARIFVNGAYSPSSLSFSEARPYTLFVEGSVLNADYKADPTVGFEGGVQYTFYRNLGAAVSFGSTDRDGGVDVRTELPHPLYFDQKRQVSLSKPGFPIKETALHFDLVYSRRSGPLEIAAFAGVTRIKVEGTLASGELVFAQTYPFDSATLLDLPSTTVEDTPTGFNVGGSLDYVMGSFGLGAQLRYTSAKAKLSSGPGTTIEVDGGGLQVAAGLRVYF